MPIPRDVELNRIAPAKEVPEDFRSCATVFLLDVDGTLLEETAKHTGFDGMQYATTRLFGAESLEWFNDIGIPSLRITTPPFEEVLQKLPGSIEQALKDSSGQTDTLYLDQLLKHLGISVHSKKVMQQLAQSFAYYRFVYAYTRNHSRREPIAGEMYPDAKELIDTIIRKRELHHHISMGLCTGNPSNDDLLQNIALGKLPAEYQEKIRYNGPLGKILQLDGNHPAFFQHSVSPLKGSLIRWWGKNLQEKYPYANPKTVQIDDNPLAFQDTEGIPNYTGLWVNRKKITRLTDLPPHIIEVPDLYPETIFPILGLVTAEP